MAASNTSAASSSELEETPQMDKRLFRAATSGDFTSIQIVAAVDRNILLGKTPQGNTCLHIASIHGHQLFCMDVVEREESLLAAVNMDRETPLLAAVRNCHVSLASFLLWRCCQPGLRQAIKQQDMDGFNVLHHAIRNGYKDLALELTTAEPGLSKDVNKYSESPLFFAVRRNFTHVYEKLMQNPDCAYSGQNGWNCLHAAVKNGDTEFTRIIMKKRPELARKFDNVFCTPVRHAVLDGKIDVLRVMLEHDSSLGYEKNSNGYPLLTAAAFRGQVAAARELLMHCPDASYYNTADCKTLLHVAVWYDHVEFVEFVLRTPLLRKLVNLQDNDGKTALHYAVQRCNPIMVLALLSHEDIDATVLDKKGAAAGWEVSHVVHNAKTLNWNKTIMLMSKAYPQDAPLLHNIHVQAKRETTDASRKDAKSLTKTYTSNTSLVAILITTITFAAAFTLPGGYNSAVGSEGIPTMSHKVSFHAFLISDTLAMCSSFVVAFICIIARWEDYEFLIHYISFTKKLMWFAFMATTTAFSTGLYTVLAPQVHWLASTICVLVASMPIITWLLGEWPVVKLRFRLGKTFNSDLLQMV